VIAIGAGSLGKRFAHELKSKTNLGITLIGFLDDDISLQNDRSFPSDILGSIDDLENIVLSKNIDEVYITINSLDHHQLFLLIQKCKTVNCKIKVFSNHFEIIDKKISDKDFSNFNYTTLNLPYSNIYKNYVKRIVDLFLSCIILIATFPFLMVIGFLIKLNSHGPIFFKTETHGKNGKEFLIFKFRSMFNNVSNENHKKLVEDFMGGKIDGAKLRQDPRITKIGKIIRKYSLDEFPQLINVIKGDMSLVGPRPSLPYEFNLMDNWHKYRYSVLPGMTGFWQVSGRSEVSFRDMVLMDIYYIENCSFWFDIKILIKTINVVFKGKGGY